MDDESAVLFYLVGVVGAAVYFIQHDASVVGGILRALVWPAYLVYYGLQALGAK